jgi:serine/threonine protein kinase
MPYCLNPTCASPQNSVDDICETCRTTLRLNQRYQALKPIGQGGFGRTFLAVDLAQTMKPRCVIKQLYPQQKGGDIQAKASDLFRQEAQQLKLAGQYPSIPTFLDYFEQEGFQYLVQEYIEGQNLAEISATGRHFTESEVKVLLETMLETLDFLHYHQIIHRDIKPANIIQTLNERFVLVDLGAAKLMTGTALGVTGTVIGSAEYVAPEQLRGKAIFSSDLYSLGATCVTLLTGMSPFSLFDTSTGAWEWRDYLQQPVSDRLGKVLDGMLIGPTQQRYGSAIEVLDELQGRSNIVQSMPSSIEQPLPSQDIQTTKFATLEVEFSPDRIFIRRERQSTNETGSLENIVRGSALVSFASVIFLVASPVMNPIVAFVYGVGFSAFIAWLCTLFIMFLARVRSGNMSGAELCLMNSSPSQTEFIFNLRGRKRQRRVLTKSITRVEVTRAWNDASFGVNIWMDEIYYKLTDLTKTDSAKLANSIADWLDVPLYYSFPED